MSVFKKYLFNFIFILLIGAVGGVMADEFILPYLATKKPFNNINFIRRINERTTIINKTEEIVISKDTAVTESILKIMPTLIAIQTYQNKVLLAEASGFIVASDGVIATTGDLISAKADQYRVIKDNQLYIAKVIKKDLLNNLAFLKIEQDNLPVVDFADLNGLRLGEEIILVGAKIYKDKFYPFASIGNVRGISGEQLLVNLDERDKTASGGPLINLKGEALGMNFIGPDGLTQVITVGKIKDFIGSL